MITKVPTGERWRYDAALRNPCTVCNAKPGQDCISRVGRTVYPHVGRFPQPAGRSE